MKKWEKITNNLTHTRHKMNELVLVYLSIGLLASKAEWITTTHINKDKSHYIILRGGKNIQENFGSSHTKNQVQFTKARGHRLECHFQECSPGSDSLSWLPLEGRPWIPATVLRHPRWESWVRCKPWAQQVWGPNFNWLLWQPVVKRALKLKIICSLVFKWQGF